MDCSTNKLRSNLLRIIQECSDSQNISENNSLIYAGVNKYKLHGMLKDRYDISANFIFNYPNTNSIKLLIDKIAYLNPKERYFVNPAEQNNKGLANKQPEANLSLANSNGILLQILDAVKTNSYKKEMEQKRKYEYIIGIDLGHGETSAAICPLQWDSPVEQLDPAKDLEMGGNKKVIPSAITILNNGTAYIGDSAFNPEILKQAEVNVCFKKAPTNINGESEKLMIRYMQEVYRRIRENNSAMLTEGNHLVYIATPSGWDKQTQDIYLQMAKQAGLPIAGLTKESRAAFVRAQHDVTSGIGKYVEKGAIVFDMGSSTLDFTYMNSDQKLIDHGYDCGASFVERSIFKQCKEKYSIISRFEEKYPKLMPCLLFEARKIKEQVYFDPTLKVRKTINFEEFIDDEDFEDDRFKMEFKPGDLNKLLEQIGYIKEIEDAARDYRNNHIHDAQIFGVFLTGGASRMDFIKPLISKCWNIPESQIYRDQDPSLTISQGVAEVARIDLRSEGSVTSLEQAINEAKSNDAVFNSFSNQLSATLEEQVISTVANVVTAFKEDMEDWTLYELQQIITKNVGNAVTDVLQQAPQILESAMDDSLNDVQNLVATIVAGYSNQGIKIETPKIQIENIDIDDINLDSVIETISSSIEVESTNWLKYALMGAGAIFGFIGMGIGYLAGKLFGDENLSEAEKRDKAMSKSLGIVERSDVYDSIAERWNDIAQSIHTTIEDSIMHDDNLRKTIRKTTNCVLEDYKAQLKKARILIE